jgi:hypothetical protein
MKKITLVLLLFIGIFLIACSDKENVSNEQLLKPSFQRFTTIAPVPPTELCLTVYQKAINQSGYPGNNSVSTQPLIKAGCLKKIFLN